MTHRAQPIFDEILARLSDHAITDLTVTQNRAYALPKSIKKAISIRLGGDEPLGEFGSNNMSIMDSELTVYVRIHIKATEVNLDNELLTLREFIHKQLMTDYKLGLAHVIQIYPGGADEPDIEAEAEYPSIVQDTTWVVQYRHSYTDPGN